MNGAADRGDAESFPTAPPVPLSSPRASASPICRRARAAEQVASLTRDPVLVGALMTDVLVLLALTDAAAALAAARVAVTNGDTEAWRVEVGMALRCIKEALAMTD